MIAVEPGMFYCWVAWVATGSIIELVGRWNQPPLGFWRAYSRGLIAGLLGPFAALRSRFTRL